MNNQAQHTALLEILCHTRKKIIGFRSIHILLDRVFFIPHVHSIPFKVNLTCDSRALQHPCRFPWPVRGNLLFYFYQSFCRKSPTEHVRGFDVDDVQAFRQVFR